MCVFCTNYTRVKFCNHRVCTKYHADSMYILNIVSCFTTVSVNYQNQFIFEYFRDIIKSVSDLVNVNTHNVQIVSENTRNTQIYN